jgi:hypothetical protein
MEFLIAAVIVVIAAYIGYKYYQAKTAIAPEPTILELRETTEVLVQPVQAKADVAKVETTIKPKTPKAEVAEKRTRSKGKFVGDDKSTPDVNEAFKDGKAPPKKKKPNIKIAK